MTACIHLGPARRHRTSGAPCLVIVIDFPRIPRMPRRSDMLAGEVRSHPVFAALPEAGPWTSV
jgi:hypothetical protein